MHILMVNSLRYFMFHFTCVMLKRYHVIGKAYCEPKINFRGF